MSKPLKNRPRPRVDETRVNYPIVRCNRQERFAVRCFVLSADIFGVEIHYSGRSHVCTSHLGACKFCDEGKPTRWVGYLSAVSCDFNSRFLLEVTPGVMPDVDQHVKRWKSLRGCWCELTRPSNRDTGRLHIRLNRPYEGCTPDDLPPAFDLEQTLAKIYGVPDEESAVDAVAFTMGPPESATVALPDLPSLSCRPSTVQGEPELDGQMHMPNINGRAVS